MWLYDKAREAHLHAAACTNPACRAKAHALEAALQAEFAAIRNADREPVDLTGIEPPSVSHILIAKPATEN
jgi:hypothetical protein